MADNDAMKLGGVLVAGYFLGRTKKFKLAWRVGSMVMSRRLGGRPSELAMSALQRAMASDELRQAANRLGGQLAAAAVTAPAGRLADSLHRRNLALDGGQDEEQQGGQQSQGGDQQPQGEQQQGQQQGEQQQPQGQQQSEDEQQPQDEQQQSDGEQQQPQNGRQKQPQGQQQSQPDEGQQDSAPVETTGRRQGRVAAGRNQSG